MASPLQKFLIRLAVDADLYAEYLEDRAAVLSRFALEAEDQAAIESGSVERIVARLEPGITAATKGTGQVVVSHKALIPSMVEMPIA